MATADYYDILQVPPDADARVIRAAYRALTKRFHPDARRSEASNEKMRLVNEAYAVLSDPQGRREYDVRRKQATRETEADADTSGCDIQDGGRGRGASSQGGRRTPAAKQRSGFVNRRNNGAGRRSQRRLGRRPGGAPKKSYCVGQGRQRYDGTFAGRPPG